MLTGAALLFGAISHVYLRARYGRPEAPIAWSQLMVVSQLHLCAVLLVFVSMGQSSVWLTYSIKGLEPVFGWALLATMGAKEARLSPRRYGVIVNIFSTTYFKCMKSSHSFEYP